MNKTLLLLCTAALTANSAIYLNQVGFYPNGKKVAIVLDTTVTEFTLKNSSGGEVVFTGTASKPSSYSGSSEYTVVADFTEFRTPGSYKLFAGKDSSAEFAIKTNVLNDALKATLRSFYYQRCSFALDSAHAGKWARAAGHPDTALEVIATDTTHPPINASGGWYDAGDYGKYIVNSGITTGTMLGMYEVCPDIVGDDFNIPESGNKKSDLLDEIKFQLDWMVRMQDADGGVFFKVGPSSWPGVVLPANDKTKRYVIGKSTTSTLDFAAVIAMAARVYKQYDSSFADSCLVRAQNAWKWACEHRSVPYPDDTRGSGSYEDGSETQYKDEFFWAAAELYISSADTALRDTVTSMLKTRKFTTTAGWQYVSNLGFLSLTINKNGLGDSLNTVLKNVLLAFADKVTVRQNTNAYRTSMIRDDFTWGSTATAGNYAVPCAYAHHLTGDQSYLDALVLAADFILGKNPTGYSFVTGVGSKSPRFPHHRPSLADGIDQPVPGLVVGGPNHSADGADGPLVKLINAGTPFAKCYLDTAPSYASNEVAINQNAPWALVLGYVEQYADKGMSSGIRHSFTAAKNPAAAVLQVSAATKGIQITCRIPGATADAKVTVHDVAGRLVAAYAVNNTASVQRFTVANVDQTALYIVRLVAGKYRMCQSVVMVR